MGDMFFYENYLKAKNIKYSCIDVNPVFVNSAKQKGTEVKLMDILTEEIPKADYILIQGALYHSIPNENDFIKRMFVSANKQLIIS